MNCMFGQVAYLVRSVLADPCTEADIGTPIETRHLMRADAGPMWLFPAPRVCGKCGGTRFGYLDADLQPMRGVGPKPDGEPVERENTLDEVEREAREWLGIGS